MKRATVLASLVFSSVSQAEIQSTYIKNYYDFNAQDIKGLVASVKKTGPKVGDKTVWASIKWQLNTEYSFRSSDEGCNLVIKDMVLVAEVQLPKWQNIQKHDIGLRNWWKSYFAFVEQHENLHFDNALASAKQFELTLFNMPAQLDCNKVRMEYLALKHQFIYGAGIKDQQIDLAAKRLIDSKTELFSPLKSYSNVSFGSNSMSSYISL